MPIAHLRRATLLALAVLLPLHAARAQNELVIATKVAPPFAMQDAEGRWQGLSIELWQQIAAAEQLTFEFREMTLQQMLESL